ncbi:hypothetical protein GGF46_004014 [Coemansia sp. RSA 552]|nr:hypothetical protein GGF46_004014 [Coemansia sp. RSA 552]
MTLSDTSPSYTLRYFNRVGGAEAARLLLSAAGVQWTLVSPEWPAEKEKQPFGRLPVLIEHGPEGNTECTISESGTIERYLARKYGFLPTDLVQAAAQEQLRDQMADVFNAFANRLFSKSAEDTEMNDEKLATLLSRFIKVHVGILQANGNTGYHFGPGLSYADMNIYSFYKNILVNLVEMRSEFGDLVRPKLTPEAAHFVATVEADPLVKDYMSKTESIHKAMAA